MTIATPVSAFSPVAIALTLLVSPSVLAELPEFYGVLDYSVTYTDNSRANQDRGDSENGGWFLESNFTRLGLRGNESINDNLAFIYRAEVELKSDDGGDTFGSRPTYVGLNHKGLGNISFGRIDPAFKNAKGGVDIFGLTNMSFNRLMAGNARFADSLLYRSPKWNNIFFEASYLFDADSGDDEKGNDNPYQLSLTYGDKRFSKSNFYGAIAYSDGIELIDAVRGVVQYKWNEWTFGVLAQDTEAQSGFSGGGTDERDGFGFIVNTTYQWGKWKWKGQYGQDDSGTGIIARNVYNDSDGLGAEAIGDDVPEVDSWALGAEYKFTKQLNMHTEVGQYMIDQSEYEDFEDDIFSIGLKYSF